MVCIPLLLKDGLVPLSPPNQMNALGDSSVKRAFMVAAQEVVELLKRSHFLQTDSSDRTEMVMI